MILRGSTLMPFMSPTWKSKWRPSFWKLGSLASLCSVMHGATIKTVPLVNVLAACTNNSFALLEIANCTAHLAKERRRMLTILTKSSCYSFSRWSKRRTCTRRCHQDLLAWCFLMEGVASRMQARVWRRSILVQLLDMAPSMLFLCSLLTFAQRLNISCYSLPSRKRRGYTTFLVQWGTFD